MIDPILVLIVGLASCVAIWGPLGAWVAGQKRRGPAEGFALGLLFGPFGVLVEAMLPAGAIPDRMPGQSRPQAGQGNVIAWLIGGIVAASLGIALALMLAEVFAAIRG